MKNNTATSKEDRELRQKARRVEYYQIHKKEIRERRRAYRAAYYQAHKEKHAAFMKAHHAAHVERASVRGHHNYIFNNKSKKYINYKGMPFYDGWNPDKGGSFDAGEKWVIENLGKRPEKCTMHVIHHEVGFMPGNLEWTYPRKQNNQQMFKIIAQQRHQINKLKEQLKSAEEKLKELACVSL